MGIFRSEKASHVNDDQSPPPHYEPRRQSVALTGAKSPGVRRIEQITAHITPLHKAIILVSLFFVAYCYGLDGTLRYTYQVYAVNGFTAHSSLAAINIVRGIVAAATQPTAAKIADVFGRLEVIALSIFFYLAGTIIEASAINIPMFAAGALLYQIGYTMIIFLVEVLIGDLTSTQWRIAASFVPASPFIINAWVAGDVGSAMIGTNPEEWEWRWRWGIGMFGIIYFAVAIPLFVVMWWSGRKAKKAADLENYTTPYRMLGVKGLAKGLFWQLDVPGLFILTAVLALILLPFTLNESAGQLGQYNWRRAEVIAPLILGVLCIPVLIFWERYTKHPLIPFHLLKDRTIWAGFSIGLMINTTWYCQGDYLYTVLQVAFNQSVLSATRITSLFSFVSVLTGIGTGIVVRYIKYVKPFIIAGTSIFTVGFGVLIYFRGGNNVAGIIGGQIMLGFGAGMYTYPTQAAVQFATKHEHLSIVTGLFLACFNVGLAFGGTISGAIWTHVLPGQILNEFIAIGLPDAEAQATAAYGEPITFIALEANAWGTPSRTAMVEAYRHTQRLLCIAGLSLSFLLIIFACCLRNPKLNELQSLRNAEIKAPVEESDDEPIRP